MRKCAYCGKGDRQLTREHLFPKALDALILKKPENDYYFSERIPAKYTESKLTIADVCVDCNNGILSILDSYMTEWGRVYATRYFSHNDFIDIAYDYHNMLRWILKVTYNCSRIHKTFSRDSDLLRRFRNYVMGQAKPPSRVRLSVGLVHSYIPDSGPEAGTPIHPQSIRSSTVVTNFSSQYRFTIRRISIGAFSFLLQIFEPAATRAEMESLTKFIQPSFKNFRNLSPRNSKLRLYATGQNTMEFWRDHIQMQANKYKGHFLDFEKGRSA